jgi:hypothetical protein
MKMVIFGYFLHYIEPMDRTLLSSELFNSKERVTMYFPMRIGPFSNKIAIVHFSTEGVKKKPMRDLALVFS